MFLETDVCIKVVVENIKWQKMHFQLHMTIIMFLSPSTTIKRFNIEICNEMTSFVRFCGVLFNDPSVRMLKTSNLVNWDSFPVSHISSTDYLPLSVNVNKKIHMHMACFTDKCPNNSVWWIFCVLRLQISLIIVK